MPGDASPGIAYKINKIISDDDPNFGKSPLKGGGDGEIGVHRNAHELTSDVIPKYGMPSGPGFPVGDPAGKVVGGRRRKTVTRTFPRGILRKTHKIMPARNPSRAPPTRKRAVLLVSEKKIREARKTAKNKAAKTEISTIRKRLIEKKIISSEKKNIPPAVLRTLYADAVGAGLLSN
jgi:hypothetical protein